MIDHSVDTFSRLGVEHFFKFLHSKKDLVFTENDGTIVMGPYFVEKIRKVRYAPVLYIHFFP